MSCFYDMETSGGAESWLATGLTTAEMQTAGVSERKLLICSDKFLHGVGSETQRVRDAVVCKNASATGLWFSRNDAAN